MIPQPASVSVTLPVSLALDRVKKVLFQPFDLGKWFTIGFCAWLAQLGERGGGGSFNPGSQNDAGNLHQQLGHARDYILSNLSWILPLAAFLVCLTLGLWVLFVWLSSRGKFMFLYCVALDRAEVVTPWHQFEAQANSLFLFRIVLGLIGMFSFLPLLVFTLVIAFKLITHAGLALGGILLLMGFGFALIGVGIVFFLIAKLTRDFVVPIMYLRGGRCLDAWRELIALISVNWVHFVLYFLFQIVLGLATGVIVLVVAVVTCCFCCLLLVPYVGTVLLLPLSIFRRSYSAYYLAQFGGAYDVFVTPPPAAGLVLNPG